MPPPVSMTTKCVCNMASSNDEAVPSDHECGDERTRIPPNDIKNVTMARRLHDEGSFDKGEGDTAALESARTKKSAISTSRKNRRIKRKLLRRNLSSEKLTPPEERDVPAADPKIDDGGASSLDDKVSEVIISPRELVSKSQIVDKLYVESTRKIRTVFFLRLPLPVTRIFQTTPLLP